MIIKFGGGAVEARGGAKRGQKKMGKKKGERSEREVEEVTRLNGKAL